ASATTPRPAPTTTASSNAAKANAKPSASSNASSPAASTRPSPQKTLDTHRSVPGWGGQRVGGRGAARPGDGPAPQHAAVRRGLRELFAHELGDRGSIRAARDLRHDVRHHATEIADRGCADLGDHVVHDLLELLLRERRGHELLEHSKLLLLSLRLLLTAAAA